jgi:hypothetical protein
MNQFFSFKRFNLLVLKHWAVNKKRYGLSVLAFIGLLILWFVFALIVGDDNLMSKDFQQSTYFLSLFAAGTFYASQYFRDLASKPKGSNFLLVPASTFEKFMCSILYTSIMFFIILTAAFYLVDVLMVSIAKSLPRIKLPEGKATVVNIFGIDFFNFNDDSTLNFLLFFFSIQSAFLLGSVYFKKYSFLKTIITGFVIWFILFLITYFIYHQFLVEKISEEDFEQVPNWVANLIRVLAYAIAPLLWIVTYYRLKNNQV